MKKITLLKDLETPDGNHKAGEIVEVDDSTYDWLMSTYLAERQQQVELEAQAEVKLSRLKERVKRAS